MSKHRDYISEILLKRSHLLPQSGRVAQFTTRTFLLWDALQYVGDELTDEVEFRKELLKYFPISLVACIEGYFRLVYRDLIDFGSPYLDNVSGFKDIKFNVDLVAAIYGKKDISLGELISHLLPCNNFDDIHRSMSTIVGVDYMELLLNVKHIRSSDDSMESLKESNSEAQFLNNLRKLFELRHIFCHEIAPAKEIDLDTVKDCVDAALGLYVATEFILKRLIPTPAI